MPLTAIPSLSVAGRRIGADAPPFIIAEMSGNHNQSLERALALVDAAASAGAHALKLQTYTADTMTLDLREGEFFINDSNSLWNGNSLYDLYRQAYTPWEWHRPLFERARQHGMIAFSSPFDETAVDFLEELEAPCYKIASFENTDLPLIRKAASTGKPLIMSTGMATVAELDESIQTARAAGARDIILLKCTSTYPASPDSCNLRTIPHLASLFGCQTGLSDHTMGLGVPLAAVAMGATVIEKHFTLARADGGVDAAFSLEPPELAALVQESRKGWEAMGNVHYGPTGSEKKSLAFRRTLYISADLEAGDELTADNVRAIRPGLGLPTRFLPLVLGRRVKKAIPRGTPLSWDLV